MTHKLSEVTEGASHASFGVPAILKRRFSEHVCDKPSDSRGVAQGVCDANSNPDGEAPAANLGYRTPDIKALMRLQAVRLSSQQRTIDVRRDDAWNILQRVACAQTNVSYA